MALLKMLLGIPRPGYYHPCHAGYGIIMVVFSVGECFKRAADTIIIDHHCQLYLVFYPTPSLAFNVIKKQTGPFSPLLPPWQQQYVIRASEKKKKKKTNVM